MLDTLHPPFWVRVPVGITYLFIDLGALFRCGAAVEGREGGGVGVVRPNPRVSWQWLSKGN